MNYIVAFGPLLLCCMMLFPCGCDGVEKYGSGEISALCGLSAEKRLELVGAYDKIYPSGELFLVCSACTGKWGAIDSLGKSVVDTEYDKVIFFEQVGIIAADIVQSDGSVVRKYFDWDGVFLRQESLDNAGTSAEDTF